jgi:wyosine [tRNA(Phe)-imidazoG37] synthetase (radical SAM superfamily)
MITFGPIPSRRLGQSLGINNIPPKSCSYNCIYCQVGPTKKTSTLRQNFYKPEEIYQAVKTKLDEARSKNIPIDYLSFVPDGEPTLDLGLGKTIDLLRPLGYKIAVITNGSLLSLKEVREVLYKADLISLKVDAVYEKDWRQINRPEPGLSLQNILQHKLAFAKKFQGTLITETMLIKNINEEPGHIRALADFIQKLNPELAYLAVPTRPPCESWAGAPAEFFLHLAYQIFCEKIEHVKLLSGYSEKHYSVSGELIQNILDITSVHPMRESEIQNLIRQKGINPAVLDELIEQDQLKKVEHEGQDFYVRRF